MPLYSLNIELESSIYIEAPNKDAAWHKYEDLDYEDILVKLNRGAMNVISIHEVLTDYHG